MCISELYLLCAQKMQHIEINSCTYCSTTFTQIHSLIPVTNSLLSPTQCFGTQVVLILELLFLIRKLFSSNYVES